VPFLLGTPNPFEWVAQDRRLAYGQPEAGARESLLPTKDNYRLGCVIIALKWWSGQRSLLFKYPCLDSAHELIYEFVTD